MIIKFLRLLRFILYAVQVATSFAIVMIDKLIKHFDRNVNFNDNIPYMKYYVDAENQTIDEEQNVLTSTNEVLDDVNISDTNDSPFTESNDQNASLVPIENNEQQNFLTSTNEVVDQVNISDTNDSPFIESNGQNASLVPIENDNTTTKQHQITQVTEDEKRFMMKDMPKFNLIINHVYPLRVLYTSNDYLFLAKVNEEKSIRSLERRINAFYSSYEEKTYAPQLDELCVIKYNDGKWYRGICKAINDDFSGKSTFFISLLDWGEFINVNANNIRKIQPFCTQHTPLAIKCVLRDLKLSRVPKKILWKLSNKVFNCNILARIGPNYYEIKSRQIISLLNN
ncbi:uncharacterized protein LOC126903193 [Daktulosphaira vitifoliae]|uniref:uncharacterized protein LOC126903193 n=1 Tax=Daktulosphaira vitifoliae TaxID=58002 RepID=UPI0021A9F2DE|nr:uncharacterized protein LOC126903193 [Daktulosphaira vitifoliae]